MHKGSADASCVECLSKTLKHINARVGKHKIHTHTHTYTYTHTNTYIHTYAHTCTHTHGAIRNVGCQDVLVWKGL